MPDLSCSKIPTSLPTTTSSLTYLVDDPQYHIEKPYHISGSLNDEDEDQRSNLRWKSHSGIHFSDLRGFENAPDIQENGFCFVPLDRKLPETWDDTSLQKHLLNVMDVVKASLKAEKVICYDRWFRRNNDDWKNGGERGTHQTPGYAVNTPHTDQTEEGGMRRILRTLNESERLQYMNGDWRLRIVNTWQPTNAMVENAPLAFCDRYSYDEQDLVACDRVTEDYVGEIYYMKYQPNHRWFWLRHQKPNEMAVFVNYDSHPGHGAKYCPHASFELPYWPPGAPPRESLETRLVIINRLEG